MVQKIQYNFSKDNILKKIISQIVDIAHPDKIILFGSRAMGTQKEDSDYDFCVLKKNVKKRRKLSQKIYMNLKGGGASIDVIVATPYSYNKFKNKWFLIYSEIDKTGKVVYEK